MDLPHTWRNWVKLNLDNGCSVDQMANDMVKTGEFTLVNAYQAIHSIDAVPDNKFPTVDVSSNIIQLDRPVEVISVFSAPKIVLLGNVLSHEECDQLVELAKTRFIRSLVVGDTGTDILSEGRTSDGAMFTRGETTLISRVEARIASLTQWPISFGEGMQLQQYKVGNEYRPHFDWFDETNPGHIRHLTRGGQRLATVILYLTDVEAGGCTSFPNIGLDLYPKKGNAVFFLNVDPNLAPDKQTYHAGAPVVKGTKIIANKWLRAQKF